MCGGESVGGSNKTQPRFVEVLMRRLIFLLLENAGLPWLLRNLRVRGREMSILTFHRVGGAYDPQWPPMPVDVFRKLMQALSQEACIIPLERIGTIEDYPDKPLMACLLYTSDAADE